MATNSSEALPAYAELQCVSNFTFLRGASHPEELVARASQLGYQALALTDECSVAGVVRAHTEAKKWGLHLVIGSQFQVSDESGRPAFTLIALAQNRNGYGNLCELITLGRTRAAKGSYCLRLADFTQPEPAYAHLRGLPDCLVLLAPKHHIAKPDLLQQAQWLCAAFPDRAWLALTLLHKSRDAQHRSVVEHVAHSLGLPVVATGDVCMHVRSRKPMQDTLTAIRLRKSIADCGFELAPNAEQHLRARLRLGNLYPPAALAETLKIAARCTFSLDELRYEYPDELVPAGETAASYLRGETYLGAHRRFPLGIPAQVQQQLEHELALIAEMAYEPYFLTVYDIVRFARGRQILCQGRGSAANSAVCYCLGITEVDPARGNLLFERFISKERNEPPDIDVDFEHQRREEVIQYIYAKYGRQRAALTGVVISYRPKSVLRDVGKALGVDLGLVDQVAKSHRWWDGSAALAERFAECGLDPSSPVAQHWADIAQKLLSFPRHLSQHPGGFIIARGKLLRLVPIENAAMPERSVVQWDKDDLDALGLLKVDILALGMLSMIRRALELISQQRGERFELQDIPAEDPATYAMIGRADTVGVFQIESRAQMSMLPRLLPRTFYDLVIEVAIIRPGPIQGGMIHPYLRRRQGLEPVTYPSPAIEQALARTLGVPIFQEQVMQIAMLAGGFTPGEADQLRRAMAAWKRKGQLDKFQDKLTQGMRANGYSEEFAQQICQQVQGFAEYGFPESHAASFALLAYASSWLKCHEPEAFLAALLNSQPMGFYAPAQLVQDSRRHGVTVLPVDVQASTWEAALEDMGRARPAVRLGLNMVSGLAQEAGFRIEEARAIEPFADIHDLALRAQLQRLDLEQLADANALASLAGHRRQALWQAVAGAPDKGLLQRAAIAEDEIQLPAPSEADDIVGDYRSLGLTLGRHPLALLRPVLAKMRFLPADVLNTFADRQVARACGIVTVRQRPETAKGVVFLTMEDETGAVNVIVWRDLVDRQRKELLGASLLGVYGIWQREGDVRNLVAKRLVDLSHLLGRLTANSRDFC
ncbi:MULTISPECIES: error-prone DNA polymerase [Noviherbaspirillum]|jgi:error-prone DNA polymerase|uniref:Error-prone DNA polymerase n=1 Tax=Noviherbaspirillum galbum TaxID=2709383 RepID=A0A6B3ST06_9BURK|nr:error-prone DNA polymerase [Noviherbaspirillum galbum]NEX63618.1 error-prone DNA polymerase [Noviherbaspirillum galbum]